MHSEFDEQKHRKEQKIPRSKNLLNEAASGIKLTFLFEKQTDFVIADQTGYNYNVDKMSTETLYTEHNRLFCNRHPTLIFNSVYMAIANHRECVGS